MKLRAIHLFLISTLFVYGVVAWSQSAEQSPQPEQPANQEQTPQQVPPPSSTEPPASAGPQESTAPASEPDKPSTNAPQAAQESKPEAKPKPPALHHTKRKSVSKKSRKKPCGTAEQGTPTKVVVKNGGQKDPTAQLSPAVNPDQAQKQRVSTEQLLAATGDNLNRVAGRRLTQTEQSTINKIHAYMRQAKAATASGDTNRAETLAYKARQLSDDLARK